MQYLIVCSLLIWVVLSLIYFRQEIFGERKKIPVPPSIQIDDLLGKSHSVFKTAEVAGESIENEDGEFNTVGKLYENDFDIEYDLSIEYDYFESEDGEDRHSIISFDEMQKIINTVEDDIPIGEIDSIKQIQESVSKIIDTDLYEKMIATQEKISKRLDEIMLNQNT